MLRVGRLAEFQLQKGIRKWSLIILFVILLTGYATINVLLPPVFPIFKTFDQRINTLTIQKKYNSRPMQYLNLSEDESSHSRPKYHSQSQQQSLNPHNEINEGPLPNLQPTHSCKHKAIKKTASKGSKGCKSQKGEGSDRSKDDRKIGRPQKGQIDKQHSRISKQFNDIIYHYSRSLIFFHLMKGKDQQTHALTLSSVQNDWMSEAYHLMRLDNFPSIQNRSLPFLLHPNSLHFIIHYNKTNKNESLYHPQRIKYNLFAFLIKRNLLTRTVWMYISQYWTDIVRLVNSQKKSTRQRYSGGRQENYIQYEREEEQGQGTAESMAEELEKDRSIAAYEIACYLWACCRYFKVEIRTS